jgi:hypothetical protein
MPEKLDRKTMICIDFPPGAGPDVIAKGVREAGYKLLAEKAKAEQEKKADDSR